MSGKIEVILNGSLGKNFGKKWDVYADNIITALDIINGNNPKFSQWMRKNATKYDRYHIQVETTAGDKRDVPQSEMSLISDQIKKITITPIFAGAGAGLRIVVGVALMISAIWFGPAAFAMGASMALGGLMEILSPQPKKGDTTGSDGNQYYFDGPVNTDTQGVPVPVPFGRVMIGSQPISATIEIDQLM